MCTPRISLSIISIAILAVQLSTTRIEQSLQKALSVTENQITDLLPNPFPPGAEVFEDSKINDYTIVYRCRS